MLYKFFDKKSAGSGVNMHENNEHPLDLIKDLDLCCVLLIFLVNMLGLFL